MSKEADATRQELWKRIETLRAEVTRLREESTHHKHQHQKLLKWLREVAPELFQQGLEKSIYQ